MKKIIILFVVLITTFGVAFGQPDPIKVRQALETYEHKEDSLASIFVESRNLVQTCFHNFTDLQRTYLNKRFVAAIANAGAVIYELSNESSEAKKQYAYSEKCRVQADAFRQQKRILFTPTEDAYITLWCDLMAYHDITTNLRLLLEDESP